jgi:hypothetical protein
MQEAKRLASAHFDANATSNAIRQVPQMALKAQEYKPSRAEEN